MANPFGDRPMAGTHNPGAYLASAPESSISKADEYNEEQEVDSVVLWAKRMELLLRAEKDRHTQRMRQSWALFNGEGLWSKNRPKWKVSATLNYNAWVPMQWAAILTDNKPRISFGTSRREDQGQADILNASWNDTYDRVGISRCIRDAVLMSRVEGKSFIRMTYDPFANGGEGEFVFTPVSGLQVYVNETARNIHNANVVMYEYEEPLGEVLQRYPHLERKLKNYAARRADEQAQEESILQPSKHFTTPQGTTIHENMYYSEVNPPESSHMTGAGIPMREFWTFPKGPKYMTKVETLMFEVDGRPTAIEKTIEDEDGNVEFLKTVVTEGNVVYELPESQVNELQDAAKLGGIRVLAVYDCYEVFTHKVSVPLYPTGRRVVIAGDVRADDGMNPYAHGRVNLIEICAYRDPRYFWGFGDSELIKSLVAYASRLLSILLDAALMTANPLWRIPISSELTDDDITNAPGAIQREDQLSLKMGKREGGPEMPSYLMQTLSFVIERIREISGLSEIATGGKMKGQQAAETVSMYQEAAGVRFRDALHDLETALVEIGYQYAGLVAQFVTGPQMVNIKDEAGVDQPTYFQGIDIHAPIKVQAKAGSAMPQSPSARLDKMLELLNSPKPIVDLPEVWALLQEVGFIESASALEHRITKEKNSPTESWKVMPPAPPPGAKKNGGQNKGRQSGSTRSRSSKS